MNLGGGYCGIVDGRGLVELSVESASQRWQVEVTVHPAELLGRFAHPGGAPAQRHLSVPPALDVAGVVPADLDHRLNRVCRPQGADQGRRDAEPADGEGLGQALPEAGRGAGMGPLEVPGQLLEGGLGGEGVGVPVGGPYLLGRQRGEGLGRLGFDVADLVAGMRNSS